MNNRPYVFGPYLGGFTTAEDVPGVLALIKSKENIQEANVDKATSKRDAVYLRDEAVVARNVAAGLFFKIERAADNGREAAELGGEKRLMAITGAYMLGKVDENGNRIAIPTETAKNSQGFKHRAAEIGTTLVIQANDLPNAAGMFPRRCFYNLLIGATTLNLFRLAGQEVGGQKLDFDVITANVQNHDLMNPIKNWLQGKHLGWKLIERPSQQLIEATSSITDGDVNFQSHGKNFYELSPANLPKTAKYLLRCYKDGRIESDHVFDKHIAQISLNFSHEMLALLNAVANSTKYFSDNGGGGFEDVRRRLPANISAPQLQMQQASPRHPVNNNQGFPLAPARAAL